MTNSIIKIHSFDIFDTVLTRCVIRPQDIFFLMQKQLTTMGVPVQLVQQFPRIRVRAELWVRFNGVSKGLEEIKLVNIYERIGKQFDLNEQQVHNLMQLEMSTEDASIVPIQHTLDLIEIARQQGQKIIFISDMYLPLTFIQHVLVRIQAYHPQEDSIYLSNEHCFTKASGALFKYVLKDQQCLPEEVCHLGDDWHSDVAVPHRLGIKVYGVDLGRLKLSVGRGIINKCSRLIELLNV